MVRCYAEKAGNLNFKHTAVLQVVVFGPKNGCNWLPTVARCDQMLPGSCQVLLDSSQVLPDVARCDQF